MIGNLVVDKAETGYYEQGQKVIRLLLTVVTSLGVVMVPRMASTFASGDKKQIQSYLKMSFRFVFFLAFPIMFGIVSISKDFVPIFFAAPLVFAIRCELIIATKGIVWNCVKKVFEIVKSNSETLSSLRICVLVGSGRNHKKKDKS
mgnify:CR=1 FL=1